MEETPWSGSDASQVSAIPALVYPIIHARQQQRMQSRIPCEAATGSSAVGLWRCPAASRAGRRLCLADERKGQQLQPSPPSLQPPRHSAAVIALSRDIRTSSSLSAAAVGMYRCVPACMMMIIIIMIIIISIIIIMPSSSSSSPPLPDPIVLCVSRAVAATLYRSAFTVTGQFLCNVTHYDHTHTIICKLSSSHPSSSSLLFQPPHLPPTIIHKGTFWRRRPALRSLYR